MRCVGTDLKFHWVRHDEDGTPPSEAAPIDGSKGGDGGQGQGGAMTTDKARGPGGSSLPAPLTRRASMADRLLQKRKVGYCGGIGVGIGVGVGGDANFGTWLAFSIDPGFLLPLEGR